MSFVNWRPSRVRLSAAVLAMIAALSSAQSGGSSSSSGATCIPQGKWEIQTEPPSNESGNYKSDTSIVNGDYVPDDGTQDFGSAREQTHDLIGPPENVVAPGFRGLKTKGKVFAWAEDGDIVTVTFNTSRQRNHTFRTECVPAPGHNTNPLGRVKHKVEASGNVSYMATGIAGAGHRSGSMTMVVDLPTGEGIVRTVVVADPTTSSGSTTVGGSAAVGVGLKTKVVKGKGSSIGKGEEEDRVGIDGKIEHESKIDWTGAPNESNTNYDAVKGKKEFETLCHGNAVIGVELTRVFGTVSVVSLDDPEDLLTAQLWGYAESRVYDTMEPLNACGQTIAPAPPETGGGSTGGQTGIVPPTPGGGEMPEASGSFTSSQARANVVSLMTEPGMAMPFSWASFHATLSNGGQGMSSSVFFRVAPTYTSNMAMTQVGLAWPVTEFWIGQPIVFDPFLPLTLTEGEWEILVGVIPLAVGRGDVQMSLSSNYGQSDTRTARLEVVPQSFSIIGFDEGDHSNPDPSARTIDLSGAGERIRIESLFSNSIGLGIPTMTYTVTSGAPVTWTKTPQMVFDVNSLSWQLAMAPNSACELSVTISFGGQSLTFPVVWKSGVPNS